MSASAPAPLATLIFRALLRRCPRCGSGGIFRTWFTTHHACPTCGQVFERGESSDFWIGSYLINLVVAELAAVVISGVLWLALRDRASFEFLWGMSMFWAAVMPIIFYPFARGLWLAIDLYFRPSEEGDNSR